MNYSAPKFSSKRGFPSGNPIANAIVIVVGALVIGASVVLGFIAFVILASVFIIFSAIVGIRLWWFSRKLRDSSKRSEPSDPEGKSGGVIEGEYHVVIEERIDRKP